MNKEQAATSTDVNQMVWQLFLMPFNKNLTESRTSILCRQYILTKNRPIIDS